ncbi:hypothetical protein F2Q69_00046371 [Brassica cretica]|uniref:Uncharacterized protein n=1 Tax=Brassica cretica TaxID=69181 RepID=A0A8S9Q4V7_BRACR|nr:hypothetical protein F2Q69_00046371 [Brassica cretica]
MVGFWSHWFFFFLSVFLSGFLTFVLTAKCGSAFFGRVALAIMEGAVLAEIVIESCLMEFDFRGSMGLVVGSEFLVPRAFQSIRSGIGLECFVGVGAPYRFRLIHSSLSFGGSCPAAVVVVSFLPRSVQIERLGSPEFRTERHFGGLMYSLMDRGTFDSFLERSWLDDLRAPSHLALIDQRWSDSQSFDYEFYRLGSRPFPKFWSALLESGLEESAKLV